MFKKIGPGVLIAAAFIGPGTVTACTLAGVEFGYSLLWAMLVSIIATVVLQEMSARLGIITQKGLADVIKAELHTKWIRISVVLIILAAIVIGNAAYEGGNIGGGVLGMQAIFGSAHTLYYPWIIGGLAFILLYFGNYKVLEKVFVALVSLMSISFLITALMIGPNILAVLKGMLIPSLSKDSVFTVIALVGTTVVPYNLFLHASLVSKKWKHKTDLKVAKRDSFLAIVLGGVVSLSIIITATGINGSEVNSVIDLAKGLEPLYGKSAKYFIGIGLFAAGITSAITAPMAAAFVASSCFGWAPDFKNRKFRAVWIIILCLGLLLIFFGSNVELIRFYSFVLTPIEIIKFAQITNGILLPVIAIFLLWVVNKKSVMGEYKNTVPQNIIGFIIILFAIALGVKAILRVIELI